MQYVSEAWVCMCVCSVLVPMLGHICMAEREVLFPTPMPPMENIWLDYRPIWHSSMLIWVYPKQAVVTSPGKVLLSLLTILKRDLVCLNTASYIGKQAASYFISVRA